MPLSPLHAEQVLSPSWNHAPTFKAAHKWPYNIVWIAERSTVCGVFSGRSTEQCSVYIYWDIDMAVVPSQSTMESHIQSLLSVFPNSSLKEVNKALQLADHQPERAAEYLLTQTSVRDVNGSPTSRPRAPNHPALHQRKFKGKVCL